MDLTVPTYVEIAPDDADAAAEPRDAIARAVCRALGLPDGSPLVEVGAAGVYVYVTSSVNPDFAAVLPPDLVAIDPDPEYLHLLLGTRIELVWHPMPRVADADDGEEVA